MRTQRFAGGIAGLLFLVGPPSSCALDHFVAATGTHDSPFSNWTTAAHDLQSAIDAAAPGETVWVAAGTYTSDGPDANGAMVSISTGVAVRSVSGASTTILDGDLFRTRPKNLRLIAA